MLDQIEKQVLAWYDTIIVTGIGTNPELGPNFSLSTFNGKNIFIETWPY